MKNFIIYNHSDNINASIQFYEKFGFSAKMNVTDGSSVRRVRLMHSSLENIVLALQDRKELLNLSSELTTPGVRPEVIFSTATIDYSDWYNLAETQLISIEHAIVEPWGVWYCYRDPCGNLLCVTNNIMY